MSGSVQEYRYLGAVRLVEPCLGTMISSGFRLEGTGTTWFANRSGVWVVETATGLEAHRNSFSAPPATPAARSLTFDVRAISSSATWLSRAFKLTMPRPPRDRTTDLFTPMPVVISPSPAYTARCTWAQVRISVRLAPTTAQPSGIPLEGVVLRSSITGMNSITTQTDARGEALLPLPGLPLFHAGTGTGAVLDPKTSVRIFAIFDRAATDPVTGLRRSLVDPDDVWARRTSLVSVSPRIVIGAGEQQNLVIDIPRS